MVNKDFHNSENHGRVTLPRWTVLVVSVIRRTPSPRRVCVWSHRPLTTNRWRLCISRRVHGLVNLQPDLCRRSRGCRWRPPTSPAALCKLSTAFVATTDMTLLIIKRVDCDRMCRKAARADSISVSTLFQWTAQHSPLSPDLTTTPKPIYDLRVVLYLRQKLHLPVWSLLITHTAASPLFS